jgi:pSer/pThr/pTyr-binding forkhead associated (FHA) protein
MLTLSWFITPNGEAIFSMGRLPECDLKIDDALASRRHCEIRPEPDGYRLVDLGSLNGTTVNGVKVQEKALADGDVINVGETAIRYEES